MLAKEDSASSIVDPNILIGTARNTHGVAVLFKEIVVVASAFVPTMSEERVVYYRNLRQTDHFKKTSSSHILLLWY